MIVYLHMCEASMPMVLHIIKELYFRPHEYPQSQVCFPPLLHSLAPNTEMRISSFLAKKNSFHPTGRSKVKTCVYFVLIGVFLLMSSVQNHEQFVM